MKDICSKCKGPLEPNRIKYSYCKSCHNEWMRNNRKKHSNLSPDAKKKANARAYLNVYLKRGKITKQSCEQCGNINVQAHHDNYDKPLNVRWLCRECHMKLHNESY